MSQPLTPERLNEIRQREQAATADPWRTYRDINGTHTIEVNPHLVAHQGLMGDGVVATFRGSDAQAYRNSTFAARAREDVRDLLDEVDLLRATRDGLRDDLRYATTRSHMAHEELRKAEAERDELKKRVTSLEGAAICPSVAKLYDTRCTLPIRHRGDHRDSEKRQYWSDDHAVPAT